MGTGYVSTARSILHVDMDAFYAAVEQLDTPAYRGKPVIVGADPQGGKGRGVVAAASYEARRYGVHSALPISQAYRRCPDGVFLPVRLPRYQTISSRIFAILRRFTDLVEPLSLDEAFLDVTHSLRLHGPAETIGRRIQELIRTEEGLSASVGAASTKFVAKIASDLRKPGGFVIVPPGEERAFLARLPIERLWGAGPKTAQRLREKGYATLGDVARGSPHDLHMELGHRGLALWELAQGHDDRPVISESQPSSIGSETTFPADSDDSRLLEATLLELSEDVGSRLRSQRLLASTLTLKFRDATFHTVTRAAPLPEPTDQTSLLYQVARVLLRRIPRSPYKVRLLGVTASRLTAKEEGRQLGLFANPWRNRDQLADAIDRIRIRFGRDAIRHGRVQRFEGNDELP